MLCSLQDWEQDRRRPESAVRSYFLVIQKKPALLREALLEAWREAWREAWHAAANWINGRTRPSGPYKQTSTRMGTRFALDLQAGKVRPGAKTLRADPCRYYETEPG